MEDKSCYPCEQEVIQKYPACPLQCMSPKCKAYKEPPIDSSKTPIIWIIGGPGSGKRTQCQKIIAKYGFTHLCTGDVLRAEAATNNSEKSKCVATIMKRGEPFPNDVVLNLLKEAMIAKVAGAKGFLIADYPRQKSQGIAFEKAIASVNHILYLEASAETLKKRVQGKAANSGADEYTLNKRLKTFFEDTDLVLAHYLRKLSRINAEDSVDAVFNEIVKVLDPIVT
ncbi:Adenylate kinase isoenzyme 1 [Danaus plexippus plexippus]|uniref:Adenylate kinase isoenzyme 1 n=1 Tax=Danaus plexippus plexippus TaxID=278856 RepID=A0A212EJ57_DANPL|nr:adenylate kinase isoenzyme 1-like [Danaus plexippus plexippus]OWR41498.1 Adenylate kinase isoenzyme 1 [Danaus plexippus plexippus]